MHSTISSIHFLNKISQSKEKNLPNIPHVRTKSVRYPVRHVANYSNQLWKVKRARHVSRQDDLYELRYWHSNASPPDANVKRIYIDPQYRSSISISYRDLRIGEARNEEARDGKTSEKKRERQRKLRKNILKLIKISNNTYSWTGSNNK